MSQHFLLSAKARTLSLARVMRLSDAEAYLTFKQVRWPEGANCPRCGSVTVYEYKSRPIFKCKDCSAQFSVTTGTIFASRKLKHRDILAAVAIFVNGAKGISALQLSRDLDVQYKTAFVLAHKIREAMGAGSKGRKLSGHVEIDGAYFGGHIRPENRKEDRRDRRLAENQTGKRRAVVVMRERAGNTLTTVCEREDDAVPVVAASIAHGSTVYADEAPGWDVLHATFATRRVNHSIAFLDDGVCTNQAESFFIHSQQGEGWNVVTTPCDDGGFSGGTLERPALKRLLADIEAGTIDTVVVYKIDRLTRSLMDFSKIVETFDRHNVSFVAVTQQFNTTTSMGRLTLNVLLSFAQFEREVTGERIRDKIAASKKKGMWMGGVVPLGYDVRDRHLITNAEEAKRVRHIYKRYLKLGCVRLLKQELDRDGVGPKVSNGSAPPKCFSRGALYTILSNPLYIGEIRHKTVCYPGLHAPILSKDLWEIVQQRLTSQRAGYRWRKAKGGSSPLAGKLFDETGNRLTPSHAVKKGRRYRYYVSRTLVTGTADQKSWRLPALEIESVVAREAIAILDNRAVLSDALEAELLLEEPGDSAADAVSLPVQRLGQLLDRGAALALEHGDQLVLLAAGLGGLLGRRLLPLELRSSFLTCRSRHLI